MNRSISSNLLIRDQLDIYNPTNSFVRQIGVIPSGIRLTLFVNDAIVNWPVVDGTNIADSSISGGSIYFNEIIDSPGFYSIRFYPDLTGFWRLIFFVQLTNVEIIKEYDVIPSQISQTGGLNASFIEPFGHGDRDRHEAHDRHDRRGRR